MKLSKTEKLFLKAYYYNWDDGISKLLTMVKSKDCDKGTALLIYWLAHPEYYYKYNDPDEMPEYERPVYNLIKTIEELILSKKLPEKIIYSPDKSLIPKKLGKIPKEMIKSSKGDVKSKDLINIKSGKSEIQIACYDNDLKLVKSLISKGVDVNEKTNDSCPLCEAVIAGNTKIVEYLIKTGANLKVKIGPKRYTLMHFAVRFRKLDIARILLQAGLPIDIKDKQGRTTLHECVDWNEKDWILLENEEYLYFLLENGANKEAKDIKGFNALDLALKAGNNAAAKILKEWKP
ncbi:MAG: DUF4274 domain-containing protein [bacterium]|nr:DUF4274 domain-containing protein [bacterium]